MIALMTLIIKTSRQKVELVTDNYYEQEIQYQDEIDAMRNAQRMTEQIVIIQNDTTLIISFPNTLITDSIKGTIHFYRASDQYKDTKQRISPDYKNQHQVQKSNLHQGKYTMTIKWTYLDKPYMVKEEILVY